MSPDFQLQQLSGLGQKERIAILLAEYSSLRSETITRTSLGFQVGAVTAVTITWTLQQSLSQWTWPWWFGLGFIIFGGLLYAGLNGRDIARAARRVREIEREVNNRAGEHLLVWEQIWGGGRVGGAGNVLGTLSIGDRSDLPPLDPKYLERERLAASTAPDSVSAEEAARN